MFCSFRSTLEYYTLLDKYVLQQKLSAKRIWRKFVNNICLQFSFISLKLKKQSRTHPLRAREPNHTKTEMQKGELTAPFDMRIPKT